MNKLLECLRYVFNNFPKLKSDYARANAFALAEAASRGYITNINVEGLAQDFWMLTLKGYTAMREAVDNEGTREKNN